MDERFEGENSVMEWGSPQHFTWLWVLPGALFVFWLSSFRRRRQMARIGDAELVAKLTASFDPVKRLWKRATLATALFFMVLALAQPHFRTKETLVERKGIDVVIALDVSNSMLAKDISPSRLEKSKLELAGLIDRLKGDRVGIVAFAGDAIIQCPLTLDRNAAKLFLSTVSPALIPLQGTAIGQAIRTARRAFSEEEKEHKALILLTDGEDHEGDALKAARSARAEGIRIFTVGIGTPDGSTLPVDGGQGFKKDLRGQVVLSKLNETLLKKIAEETGGRYFRSAGGNLAVDQIASETRKIAQKGMKKEWSVEYEENYQLFLIAAFVLLLAEMAVPERRKER